MPRMARPTGEVCQKPDGTSDSPVRFKALLGSSRHGTISLVDRAGYEDALAEAAVREASDGYTEALELHRDLEAKARGNITVAGLFLAGAFGFAGSIGEGGSEFARSLFALAVVSLGATVMSAFASLLTKSTKSPLSGAEIASMVDDLRRVSDEAEMPERLRRLKLDVAAASNAAAGQLRATSRAKANWIWLSQILLVASAVIVTASVVTRLRMEVP